MLGTPIGLSLGVAFGQSTIGVGSAMCVGLGIGLCVGVIVDFIRNKKAQ
jgi:hypothetical protein